jgi:PAS domain S-box-containing protein
MGYSEHEELIGKHHSIFVEDGVKETDEYVNFWKTLREGQFYMGEITRKKKDGTLIYLQATYNPIIGADGKPYRVMKIATDVTQSYNQQIEIEKKNTYLEHAAKILRHDMHSGINTYMPRGLSGLQKRITPEIIADLKIGSSRQMIQEGLLHTQKVYKNVYEFTNLVKVKSDFKKEKIDAKISLEKYLANTSYGKQVEIGDLGEVLASEQLLCNALDNLIKNGLKYNDNSIKTIKIYTLEDFIIVEDNGTGLTSQKFEEYVKRGVDIESETGLGLGIAKAIIEEHGFELSCEEIPTGGTKMKIKITNKND